MPETTSVRDRGPRQSSLSSGWLQRVYRMESSLTRLMWLVCNCSSARGSLMNWIMQHYMLFFHCAVQWSFGITCWEIFSGGKSPYPGVDPLSVVELLDSGQRLSKPANAACPEEM